VKFQKLLLSRWKSATKTLNNVLASVHTVTVCLDGWSKTNPFSSYLCISACFFNPAAVAVRHVVLKLAHIEHPHIGEMLSEVIEQCLSEWGLNATKVMTMISDNGANMIKAVRLLNERNGVSEPDSDNTAEAESGDGESQHDSNSDSYEDVSDSEVINEGEQLEDEDFESDEDADVQVMALADMQQIAPYRRLMCIAHSLHLVIKKAYIH
jgi:hypothetical protein